MKKIYLAGGCFWGLEDYFQKINGVIDVISGYANGQSQDTKYELLKQTGHAETIEIKYDESIINLREILLYYFRVIDPTSINKQGNDVGTQYRTGIYYIDENEKDEIEEFISQKQTEYQEKIQVEVQPLKNFTVAEEYHQDYLQKNPNGYCHINVMLAYEPLVDLKKYSKPEAEEIKEKLTEKQFNVTQKNATERPFENEYWDNHEVGIYVDIVTGEPLFLSTEKFDSGCGWPSFTKPVSKEMITYHEDNSLLRKRIEVRSKVGDSHLGHVFNDGPVDRGGLRYCINSASMKFIPKSEMEQAGYSEYIKYLENV